MFSPTQVITATFEALRNANNGQPLEYFPYGVPNRGKRKFDLDHKQPLTNADLSGNKGRVVIDQIPGGAVPAYDTYGSVRLRVTAYATLRPAAGYLAETIFDWCQRVTSDEMQMSEQHVSWITPTSNPSTGYSQKLDTAFSTFTVEVHLHIPRN